MGQTGGGDHTKSWSLGRRGHKSNWDCLARTEPIQFKPGIYQGDTLFPLLLIMSWKLRTLQEYKLSKPVYISISHAFFIHHLKLYSSSEGLQGIKVALTHQMINDKGLSMVAKKANTISLAKPKDVGLRRRFATIRWRDDWRPRRQHY